MEKRDCEVSPQNKAQRFRDLCTFKETGYSHHSYCVLKSEAKMNSSTPDVYANFSDPTPYLETCLFTLNVLLGPPTHFYILWLIITGAKSKIASEFFNLNLSICEIGNCLNSLFYLLKSMCSSLLTLVIFVQGLAVTGRPLFQCLMCVERYLAVVHPVTFLKFKPLRYRLICCAMAWIITLGGCCLCRFILSPLNLTAYTLLFSTQFLLFLSIQLFCLVAVLRALKQSGPGEKKKEENHMRRRAFYLILIITVNVAVIHVPYAVIALYTMLMQEYDPAKWFPGLFCYVLAGFVQPILYLHRTKKLKCSS
ncbi:P2Y purinoceptor 8-like [Danio rerio]|uniref:P2Y purinoceptor 8-like n=1 Tax=Danio rerio TaxID=7955 RepID=A0AC58IBA8_DANRE